MFQADAIASKLQNIENQENDGKPTVLVAADTVCVLFPLFIVASYQIKCVSCV